MSSIYLFLRTVNDSVNVFKMNQPYSEPKIFTGGVDINQWKGLSSIEKKLALSKEWFVYYSFRDPKSRKLKRQSHIKAGANRHKSMRVRLKVLKTLQRNLFLLLDNGFNPYEDNTTNKERFLGTQKKGLYYRISGRLFETEIASK